MGEMAQKLQCYDNFTLGRFLTLQIAESDQLQARTRVLGGSDVAEKDGISNSDTS